MEDRDLPFETNAPGDGQGNWFFTLLATSALVFSIPQVKEVMDPIRAKVRQSIVAEFDTARQRPNCGVVPVSHSPAAMMIMAEKFPQAGCEPKKP